MNTPGISLHAVSICSRRQKKNGWSLGETGADGGFRPTTSFVIYLETIVVTASVWQANGIPWFLFRATDGSGHPVAFVGGVALSKVGPLCGL
ncbi:hypothetical protein NPIL_163931 [Nephila pilipes]|uniref:Uncharacterized protein n=1 Tax=Nephila pilipes TaxID=299642 RepID=A0A8X6NL44_NEPPI|nr:hypothetical protein NPIL_163931 [Nephila pilipes]